MDAHQREGIGRSVSAATDSDENGGLNEGFRGHSPQGHGTGSECRGAESPELMTAGRWDSPTMPTRYTEVHAADRSAVARYYRGDLMK